MAEPSVVADNGRWTCIYRHF